MAENDITPGELARRMQDVLVQFSHLVEQVESRYVRKDLLELYKQGIDSAIQSASSAAASKVDKGVVDQLAITVSGKVDKADHDALKADVAELKDTNKWLFRLVMGLVIAAVVGTVIVTGGAK